MYTIKKKEKLEGSVIEFQIEIDAAAIEKLWPHAIEHVGEHVNLPGFRKGHIPEKVLVSQVGEMAILEEAAEHAINDAYGDILKNARETNEFNPIGSPKVVITKIAKGAPVEATIRIAMFPEVTLPDYTSLAKKVMSKKDEITVEEKEIENVFEEIKKSRPAEDGKPLEITDEFVKTLGEFKDVADFREKIKENITKEKEYRAKEKKRIESLDAIREKTKIEIPDVLIESELDRMVQEFSGEISRMGATWQNYLTQIKKTESEIREEWKERAKTRVVNEIILFEIAKKENIKPNPEEVEKELKHLKEHYPDAADERLKLFIEEMISKEEVFKFLESSK